MTLDENRVEVVAGEIARYLVQHPDAADTFDGITRWWITRIRFDEASQVVGEALDGLVREGRVVKERLPDGTLLYRSALQ